MPIGTTFDSWLKEIGIYDEVMAMVAARLTTPLVRVTSLEQTCYACPSQWEGETDNGDYVYIRYRWGHLTVSVNGEQIFATDHGNSLDGVLSYDELRTLLPWNIQLP
jgi:hypothetical protein